MADYQNDFNDIKNALKGVVSGVAGIAKDIASTAGDKAKAVGRIARLSMDVSSEKAELEKVYSEIGRLYYETYGSEPAEFFIQLCDQAKLAQESITAKEQELASLRECSCQDSDIEVEVGEFEDAVAKDESDAAPGSDETPPDSDPDQQ